MEKLRESEQKYFEKKRLALEREQQEKLEQEMYEYELERRRLRVSNSNHYYVSETFSQMINLFSYFDYFFL